MGRVERLTLTGGESMTDTRVRGNGPDLPCLDRGAAVNGSEGHSGVWSQEQRSLVGLDIGSSAVKAVELAPKRGPVRPGRRGR